MLITELHSRDVEILTYQSTFVSIKVEGNQFRYDFIDKQEFILKKGSRGVLYYFVEHPLLLDYNEGSVQTFINSKPADVEKFIGELKITIEDKLNGWRNWTSYVSNENNRFTMDTFHNNIRNGTGQLSRAPWSINEKIVGVCRNHNVETFSIGDEGKKHNYHLVMIGRHSYIIAKEFRFHNMT
jgi:hypothetical protein